MVRGHLATVLTVILLVITGVRSECVNNDNDDMLSLLFKKMDKMQDKHQDEMTAMREKMQENMDGITGKMQGSRENMQDKHQGEMTAMREKMQENIDGITEQIQGIRENMQDKHQDEMTAMREKMQENIDGITEQMQGIRENMQENIDGMREKMQEKIDGMTEKSQKMQEEIVGMKEKLQGQEEINELKIERIEEKCDQFENKANDKPSVDINTVSNNETSLAMAVLQLSTSLENLQTCRGGEDTDIEARLTEQMSRLIDTSSPSSESNVSHIDTAIDTLTNRLSEVRTTVEDLQARVQDLVSSEGNDNQQLAPRNNMTSVDQDSKQMHYTNERKPRYCHDIYIKGERRDGVFQIYPGWNESRSVNVWCEFDVGSDIGWTVILSRMPTEEPVNFSQGWEDYKAGFGNPHTEYWIGLSFLYEIMYSHCSQVLHVSLHSWDHTSRHAQYKDFSIGDEESGYQLSIGGYSGDAGDSLTYHNRMKFSTKDKDNDKSGNNCAEHKSYGNGGGFWYNSCAQAYPCNPVYEKGNSSKGIQWAKWLSGVNLKKIIFKISPKLPIFI